MLSGTGQHTCVVILHMFMTKKAMQRQIGALALNQTSRTTKQD